jgi:hypothetical protein
VNRARTYHGLTAVVALVALVLQLVQVAKGSVVLVDTHPPGLVDRLLRYVAYFTIQSNVLVLLTAAQLARDPAHDGRWWRVVRTAAISGISVTGLVHWFLLRKLLDLHGADYLADRLATSPSRSWRCSAGCSSVRDRASTGAYAYVQPGGRSHGSS